MPKHTYDVTIGKDTYEVSSDHELTDGQAYQAALTQSKAPQQSGLAPTGSGGMGLAGLRGLQPIAEGVATSPTLPKTAASIGRMIGGVAPAIGGAYEAGPIGGLAGLAAAAKGAWAGGKTGWFTGKLMQNMAAPVASGLEKISPLLGKASGAQGLGDLAQMAEPDRKDIGFLGIGKTQDVPGQKPALLNSLLSRFVKIGPETQ